MSCLLFNSLAVGFAFNQISGGPKWWLSCCLVVILMWLCEEASTAFIYASISTRSSWLPLQKGRCLMYSARLWYPLYAPGDWPLIGGIEVFPFCCLVFFAWRTWWRPGRHHKKGGEADQRISCLVLVHFSWTCPSTIESDSAQPSPHLSLAGLYSQPSTYYPDPKVGNPPAAISSTPFNTVLMLNSPLFYRLGMLFPADKEDTESITCHSENCLWSVPMWQISWVTWKYKKQKLYLCKLKQKLEKFRSLTHGFFYMTPNNTTYFLPLHCTKMIWIFTVLGREQGGGMWM